MTSLRFSASSIRRRRCCAGARVDVRRDAVAGRVRIRDVDPTAGAESSNLGKNLTADVQGRHLVSRRELRGVSRRLEPVPADAPTQLSLADRKTLRPHQQLAIAEVIAGFDAGADRGQMIMACGTGKTFTSLRLAEQVARGRVGSVPRAVDQPVVADRRRMGERRTGPARNLRCLFGSSCRQAQQERRGHVGQRPPSLRIDERRVAHEGMARTSNALTHGRRVLDVPVDRRDHRRPGDRAGRFDLVVCDEAHRTTGGTGPTAEQSHIREGARRRNRRWRPSGST